ncbi:hypothetical protein CRG98_047962, partial [Punica granatum]
SFIDPSTGQPEVTGLFLAGAASFKLRKRDRAIGRTIDLVPQFFIDPATGQPNVSGLILAGAAGFKIFLSLFFGDLDSRLRSKILNVVDVPDGGERGFNQAIELSAC